MGSLLHFRRPEVTVEGSEVTVHDPDEKEPVKLTLHHKPFTVTMGYMQNDKEAEKVIILDPSRPEEEVLSGFISIAINKHREVKFFVKTVFNPGAPGKIDPRGLHFAHKNVQIDLLCKKFKTGSNRTGLFTLD